MTTGNSWKAAAEAAESWADQDREDLRRARADLEECRATIKELRAALDTAVEALKLAINCDECGECDGCRIVAELGK